MYRNHQRGNPYKELKDSLVKVSEPTLESCVKIQRNAGDNGRGIRRNASSAIFMLKRMSIAVFILILKTVNALIRVVPPDSGPLWDGRGAPPFCYIING